MSNKPDFAQLRQFLVKNQLLQPGSERDAEWVLEVQEKSAPRYHFVVRALSFIGITFLTAIALLSLYFLLEAIDLSHSLHEEAALLIGSTSLGLSWLLYRQNRIAQSMFANQLLLILLAVAKILLSLSIVALLDDRHFSFLPWIIAGLTAATWFTFNSFEDKFASLVALIGSIYINLAVGHGPSTSQAVFFSLEILALGGMVSLTKWRNELRPAIYAVAATLPAFLMYLSILGTFTVKTATTLALCKSVLALALAALVIAVARSNTNVNSAVKNRLLGVAIVGIVLLGWFATQQILLSLFLIALGHYLYERWITISGLVFLPLSIFWHYYNLNIPLLEKSFYLQACGAVLIAYALFARAISRKESLS